MRKRFLNILHIALDRLDAVLNYTHQPSDDITIPFDDRNLSP